MSIFSKIGGFLKNTVGGAIGGLLTGGAPGAIVGGLSGALGGSSGGNQQLVAMPGAGSRLYQSPASVGQVFGSTITQAGLWPTQGQLGLAPSSSSGYSYRRMYNKNGTPRRIKRNGQPYAIPHMNPMNPRAARRAVVRIRGARKLLQRIERSLPRATQRRRAA